MSKMLKAMAKLNNALHEVNHEWDRITERGSAKEYHALNNNKSVVYPFDKDLIQVVVDVALWVDQFEEAINKYEPIKFDAYAMCFVNGNPDKNEFWEDGFFYKVEIVEGSDNVLIEDELGRATEFHVTRREFKRFFVIVPDSLYEKYMKANEEGIDCNVYRDQARNFIV